MTPDPELRAMWAAFSPAWCLRLAAMCIGMAVIGGSHASDKHAPSARVVTVADAGGPTNQTQEARMWMTAGGQRFAFTLADTDAARAFAARLPMTLDMTDLNDNEKKFDLPNALPSKPMRPGTIRKGDLLLWGDNTVVVFYKTFDSSYAYTRLGQVSDPAGLEKALGRGGVRVQFSAQP